MKNILYLMVLCSALSFTLPKQVSAEEAVVVIVNAGNNQELTRQDIKNIYADYVTRWSNDKKIKVYNLPLDDGAREVFSQAVFGESAQRLAEAESNRKITNTIKNPSKTKSARLVAKIVAKNPDAIGYIPASMAKKAPNVRVVFEIQ